jgi:hypothetical protein
VAPRGTVLQGIDANGTVAMGYTLDAGHPPFLWDASSGMRLLGQVLEAANVDVRSWELGPPVAISPDGRVVFGEGKCGNLPSVYRAVVPQ